MNILITIAIASIISAGVGYWLGKTDPGTIAQLEDFTNRLETVNRNGEVHLVQRYELAIPILLDLESDQFQNARDRLVEEFGRFYYNYTHDDERDMTSATVQAYLKRFESLAPDHHCFREVIEFVPND